MNYPILRPVRIKTKGYSWYKQIWVWLTEPRKFEIIEDYIFYIPWFDIRVKIPKGFIFDGASIPRIFWFLLAPTGILFIPALFHDYGYKYNKWLDNNNNDIFVNAGKKFFDEQFGKLAVWINDMTILDYTAFFALRGFGYISWYKHRKKDKRNEK